jgi:magnesium transporter
VSSKCFLIKDNVLIFFKKSDLIFHTHIRERIRTHTGIIRTKSRLFIFCWMP